MGRGGLPDTAKKAGADSQAVVLGPLDQPASPAACLDCGLDYSEFAMDVLLPRSQWLDIHPDEHGLLCARCIVKRAAKMPGAISLQAVIAYAPGKA
jgi:hypothetical protein